MTADAPQTTSAAGSSTAQYLSRASEMMKRAADEVESAMRARDSADRQHKAQQRNTVAFCKENERLRSCLAFFASVIKSGEPWTRACEAEYEEALRRE